MESFGHPPSEALWCRSASHTKEGHMDVFDVDYCDYCERKGHTFRSCPARDDDPGFTPPNDPNGPWRDPE